MHYGSLLFAALFFSCIFSHNIVPILASAIHVALDQTTIQEGIVQAADSDPVPRFQICMPILFHCVAPPPTVFALGEEPKNPLSDSVPSPFTEVYEACLKVVDEHSYTNIDLDKELGFVEQDPKLSRNLVLELFSQQVERKLIHISISEVDSTHTVVKYLFLERKQRPFGSYESVKEKIEKEDVKIYNEISAAIRQELHLPPEPAP
jgi:hypothetical protein